jgi:phosphate transport system substrate-binding protein
MPLSSRIKLLMINCLLAGLVFSAQASADLELIGSGASFPAPLYANLPGSDVPDLRVWVNNPAGAQAYPIASFTWLLLYKDQDDNKARTLRELVEYSLTTGQKSADAMGYIPLPENVVERVRTVAQMVQ